MDPHAVYADIYPKSHGASGLGGPWYGAIFIMKTREIMIRDTAATTMTNRRKATMYTTAMKTSGWGRLFKQGKH